LNILGDKYISRKSFHFQKILFKPKTKYFRDLPFELQHKANTGSALARV